MDPYISFLSDGSLPTNVKKAENVCRMLARFWLSKDKKLYWQSFGGPYLLCLHSNNVTKLLAELHKRDLWWTLIGEVSVPSSYDSGILVAEYAVGYS